jgi:hypothetical protein
VLFSYADLDEALRLLISELVADGAEARIGVVGAAAVALQVGREALTRDVDALYAPNPAIDDAVRRIARARNWPDTWLNDAAKMFASHHDTEADWEIWSAEHGVVISVARPQLLLAMKLLAGRGRRDAGDIDRLLDACEIRSRETAAELFDRYYPAEVIAPAAERQLRSRFP